MGKSHSLYTSMIVMSLYINYDPFRYWEKNEEVFSLEVPCLSVIETLIYLIIHIWPDISFHLFDSKI